ncbi:MAG: hypothetical protein VKK80_00325 [Prochlorothrix sp.]|nr:hypothetical protein [Prochlorothrix sp.]
MSPRPWYKRLGDAVVITILIGMGLLGLRVAVSLVIIGISGG